MAKHRQLVRNKTYWLDRAKQRITYNPHAGAGHIGLIIDVLFLIVRLLLIIIEQQQGNDEQCPPNI